MWHTSQIWAFSWRLVHQCSYTLPSLETSLCKGWFHVCFRVKAQHRAHWILSKDALDDFEVLVWRTVYFLLLWLMLRDSIRLLGNNTARHLILFDPWMFRMLLSDFDKVIEAILNVSNLKQHLLVYCPGFWFFMCRGYLLFDDVFELARAHIGLRPVRVRSRELILVHGDWSVFSGWFSAVIDLLLIVEERIILDV